MRSVKTVSTAKVVANRMDGPTGRFKVGTTFEGPGVLGLTPIWGSDGIAV